MNNKINVSLIRELRERTGIGIMDCRKLLNETNGDIELAIKKINQFNIFKIFKKAKNSEVYNGVVMTKVINNFGAILEVNCQTDFVSKNKNFLLFVNKILNVVTNNNTPNIEAIKSQFEEELIEMNIKMGETINIRRFSFLKGHLIGSYQHGTRIGVLVAINSDNKELAKHLSMHIAANKPLFISSDDIPSERINEEFHSRLNIAIQSGKIRKIAEKIARGQISKFINEISLKNQPFVMDLNKTIAQLLKEHNTEVISFIRFEVGEDIEKTKVNFLEEVNKVSQKFL